MKESKDEAILPCCSDDTHDKVYELNKQMCDIDKHLSEAGYFRMICDGQIETRKKLIDMEEKKTKKMTKAEAFEYLKHKKVVVTCDAYLLQDKLFEIGYRWCDGSIDKLPMIDFLFIDDETFQFTELLSHFKKYAYEEISADDILSIEIVEKKKKSEEEEALDKISCLGAQIVDILLRMKGHHHVTITETTVALHGEGMSLFHSDPF